MIGRIRHPAGGRPALQGGGIDCSGSPPQLWPFYPFPPLSGASTGRTSGRWAWSARQSRASLSLPGTGRWASSAGQAAPVSEFQIACQPVDYRSVQGGAIGAVRIGADRIVPFLFQDRRSLRLAKRQGGKMICGRET